MDLIEKYLCDGKSEIAIWGIPPNSKEEQLLFTKAKNEKEAENIVKILKKKGCKKLRIQKFSMGDDISKDWKSNKIFN